MGVIILQNGIDIDSIPAWAGTCPHCGRVSNPIGYSELARKDDNLQRAHIRGAVQAVELVPTYKCGNCLCAWQWYPEETTSKETKKEEA